ncbi:hypothetical protein GQ457_08G028460 [Hibiscus cannabinus]
MLEAILDTARQLRKSRKFPQPRRGGERQDGVKRNVETPSVWSARPAELAAKEIRKGSAEEIRRTNAAGGVQNRPAEDGRVNVVEPRAREALKVSQRQQKGGGDGRLYSESMSELASAKRLIDAGSSDNIVYTGMVDQLGRKPF